MTIAQLEERVMALEKAIEEIRHQRAAPPPIQEANNPVDVSPDKEDEFIPGVEYSFIVTVPPREERHIIGKIVAIDPTPSGLALSEAEWESLNLEDDNE